MRRRPAGAALLAVLADLLRLRRLDPWTLALALATGAVGLLVLHSAGEGRIDLLWRQAIRLGLGFLALWFCAQLPSTLIARAVPWLYGAALLPLGLVLVVGEGRGAERWLDLGVLRFQPAELAKLAVPLACALLLSRIGLPPGWGGLLACLALIAPPAVLVYLQPDLGTAVLIALAGLATVFLGGLSWGRIGLLAAGALAAIPLAWPFLHEYQRMRVLTLFAPGADPLGHGWNTIQALTAVGSGGLLGRGYRQGTQSHLEFLPERTTDFAFAVLAEEFGFVGVTAALGLYAALAFRLLQLAMRATSTFGRLAGGALALSFLAHVVVNAAMVAGLLPVVGVPMPLLSYGGTIAVVMLASFGLILALAAPRREPRVP